MSLMDLLLLKEGIPSNFKILSVSFNLVFLSGGPMVNLSRTFLL